jgi:hypothetical protein
MQISRIALPDSTFIRNSFPVTDYSDCYRARSHSGRTLTLNECFFSFLHHQPAWIDVLMFIRNILVFPFGLKTGKEGPLPAITKNAMPLARGTRFGIFEVLGCNDREIILGFYDSHLDGGISLVVENSLNAAEISLTTVVKYNNALGKVYFFLIRPFHGLVVRSILRSIVRHNIPNQ